MFHPCILSHPNLLSSPLLPLLFLQCFPSSSRPWEFNHGIVLLETFPLCIHVTRLGWWVLLYVLEMM